MTERNRPTNVTALAVLALCFGLTFLLGAAIGSVVGLGIGEAMGADNGVATLPEAITLASFAIVSISSVLTSRSAWLPSCRIGPRGDSGSPVPSWL